MDIQIPLEILWMPIRLVFHIPNVSFTLTDECSSSYQIALFSIKFYHPITSRANEGLFGQMTDHGSKEISSAFSFLPAICYSLVLSWLPLLTVVRVTSIKVVWVPFSSIGASNPRLNRCKQPSPQRVWTIVYMGVIGLDSCDLPFTYVAASAFVWLATTAFKSINAIRLQVFNRIITSSFHFNNAISLA